MSVGGQSVPAGNFIGNVANYVFNYVKSRRNSTDPSDGLILKLHYKWTFYFMIGIYTTILGSWYNKDLMDCVNKFNGAIQVPSDYLSFCHSYIFVHQDHDPQKRRYLFFYKWLHYVCLFLAFWYYMPRKFNKAFHKPILLRLCEVLNLERSKYDLNSDKTALLRISAYISDHMRTHNSLYFCALFSNVFALFVNLVGISMIDYVLQGRFMMYGWMTVPFNRDIDHFTDYMSRTFPPFAECSIARQHELTPGRVESFGCRLVLMELYEKLFFMLWVWLILLVVMSVVYLIFLILLFNPTVRRWALNVQKPEIADNILDDHLFDRVLHTCKIGDVWLLYKLKKNVSSQVFYSLLCELSQTGFENIVNGAYAGEKEKVPRLRDLPKSVFANPPTVGRDETSQKLQNCLSRQPLLLWPSNKTAIIS